VGAVRTRTSLADDLRELAICRIAVVNKAWYEWMHHAPLAVKGGVSSEAMKELMTEERLGLGDIPAGFTEKQWAVCVMADEMTKNVHVADETFAQLKSFFNDQEVIEIVATVCRTINSDLSQVANFPVDSMLQLREPFPRGFRRYVSLSVGELYWRFGVLSNDVILQLEKETVPRLRYPGPHKNDTYQVTK
jgi:hypothetical protein